MSNSYEQTDIYNGGNGGGGGSGSFIALESFPIASCRNAAAIPNINNGGGALLGTLYYSPINWKIKSLNCFIKQVGGGAIRLAVYSVTGSLLGVTAPFIPNVIGFKNMPIIAGAGGAALDEVEQMAETAYYFTIHGTSAANGAQFYGSDVGTTFGPTPWIGWSMDNIAINPDIIIGGSESSQRFYIGATGVL